MDCKQVNELLVDYLYEEIDRARATSLEEHLHSCSRCAEEVHSLRHTREMVGELEQLEPSPAIGQLLLSAASRKAPSPSSFSERLRALLRVFVMHPALAAAATLVAVLGVSFYAYREGLPPARTERRSDLPLAGETATIRPTGEAAAPALAPASPATERTRVAAGEGYRADEKQEQQPARQAPVAGVLNAPPATDEERAVGWRGRAGGGAAGPAAAAPASKTTSRQMAPAERKKNMAPPVQAPVRRGATYDDLAGDDLAGTDLEAQGTRGAARKPADKLALGDPRKEDAPAAGTTNADGLARGRAPAKGSAVSAAAKPQAAPAASELDEGAAAKAARSTAAPKPSPRRRQARREANVVDVGGGSSGVWANKSGKDRDAAEDEAVAQTAAPGATKADAAKAQALQRGLATGDAAARAGRCVEALRAYDEVLAARPDLAERVASSLGPCASALKRNPRYQAIASRATAMREARAAAYAEVRAKAKRAPAKARPAAKRAAEQKKAAPAAVDAY